MLTFNINSSDNLYFLTQVCKKNYQKQVSWSSSPKTTRWFLTMFRNWNCWNRKTTLHTWEALDTIRHCTTTHMTWQTLYCCTWSFGHFSRYQYAIINGLKKGQYWLRIVKHVEIKSTCQIIQSTSSYSVQLFPETNFKNQPELTLKFVSPVP